MTDSEDSDTIREKNRDAERYDLWQENGMPTGVAGEIFFKHFNMPRKKPGSVVFYDKLVNASP